LSQTTQLTKLWTKRGIEPRYLLSTVLYTKGYFERSYSIAVWKYHLCCYRSNLIFFKNIDFILPDKKLQKQLQNCTKQFHWPNFEHLEMVRLKRESNPEPPGPQASTLYQRLLERSYLICYFKNIACAATKTI
jgi:hypothetical protein